MKLIPRQKIWLAIVIATNLALWLIPSEVVELIARDRHTLLGRYSRTHFSWILGVAAISLVSFYVDWSIGATYRKRWFQVIAALLGLIPTLALVDFLLRSPQERHYVRDTVAYHRPLDIVFSGVFDDRPSAVLSYPNAPAGYGKVNCTLRTDRRGFRNQTAVDECDVVVLGDSFAEGSKVSDDHAWPALLERRSGLAVYNLGMSGYQPMHYLASLKQYGLGLKPDYVLCLLYEGNDFRSAKTDRKRLNPSVSKRAKRYLKQSPIISAIDTLLIETFGPLNSRRRVKGVEVLDWLPLTIPRGSEPKHYAFAPKQLRDLYQDADEFSRDKHWLNPRSQLSEMNALCAQAGCRFVVVFAPTKAHVTLPLVATALPAEKVRALTAMSYKKRLAGPGTFLSNLLERVEARETVVGEWCGRESIPFSSMTSALRTAAGAGRQVYYTYDQHWTPEGHAVVAEAVHRYLADHLERSGEVTLRPPN